MSVKAPFSIITRWFMFRIVLKKTKKDLLWNNSQCMTFGTMWSSSFLSYFQTGNGVTNTKREKMWYSEDWRKLNTYISVRFCKERNAWCLILLSDSEREISLQWRYRWNKKKIQMITHYTFVFCDVQPYDPLHCRILFV